MGNEESSNGSIPMMQLPSESYLPVGGMRMNNEKGKDILPSESPASRTIQRTHLVKTAFSGIWSVEDPTSQAIPQSRTGHFSCYSESLKVAIIGFGVGGDGQYYDDIWLSNPLARFWTKLSTNGQAISPRSGSRATVIGNTLFIFGGSHEPIFYNDLYSVDLSTGLVNLIQTNGTPPSPRTSTIFSSSSDGQEIILWGGYDGSWPSELYILDLNTFTWSSYQQDISGRSNIAYTTIGDSIFAYGSSKTGGLLVIDIKNRIARIQHTTGPEPSPTITDAALVKFDNFLMFIGGKAASQSTLMYALNLDSFRWFLFHILPDGSTVSAVDGFINELGLFMLPRIHSTGAIYQPESREIIAFLGYPLRNPSTLFILNVGEALSLLHLRSDMLQTIRCNK